LNEERLRGLLMEGLSGQAGPYRTFLSELTPHLRAYLRRRLSSLPEEVEDLLQELLLAIHSKRHTYDSRQPLTAWVRAIARYKLIDFMRRRSRTDVWNDPLDELDPALACASSAASEAQYDMARLLRELPDRQRLPIQYVKLEGATVVDAANRAGMSESAVKVGIHRGLKALAQRIRRSE